MNFREILNKLKLLEDMDFSLENELDPEVIEKLKIRGFNTDVVLYHGSPEVFTRFDKRKARTAEHIYTSPDYETAGAYGQHLYACVGRTRPLADLIDNWDVIGKVAEELTDYFIREIDYIYTDEIKQYKSELMRELQKQQELFPENPGEINDYDLEYEVDDSPKMEEFRKKLAKKYAIEKLQSGKLYEVSSQLQDHVMNICFGMGYNCVRFVDPAVNFSGGESESWVFDDGSDLLIIKKIR
jgi:hypothetical protein